MCVTMEPAPTLLVHLLVCALMVMPLHQMVDLVQVCNHLYYSLCVHWGMYVLTIGMLVISSEVLLVTPLDNQLFYSACFKTRQHQILNVILTVLANSQAIVITQNDSPVFWESGKELSAYAWEVGGPAGLGCVRAGHGKVVLEVPATCGQNNSLH